MPGTVITSDPLLGPLADNGGPTFTHALPAGSPTINAGEPGFTPPPDFDQRGVQRVLFGRVDIGAYEFNDTALPPGGLVVGLSPLASVVTVVVLPALSVISTSTPGIPGSPGSWVPLPLVSSQS